MLARLLLAVAAGAATLPAAPALESVVSEMDAAAAAWTGMRAQVRWVRYLSFVDDERVESGTIAVRKRKSGGVEMLLSFAEPNVYFLSVKGARVEVYKPKIKTVEEYDASASRDKLENALLLGFGTSGSYLREHYEMAVLGEEAVSGQQTVKVGLTPKNPQGEINNRPLEMWISTATWQPVQQKIHDVSPGDYRLYTYSEVESNPRFKDDEFKLRVERGTQRVRPQR